MLWCEVALTAVADMMNNEFEDIQDPPGGGDMGNAFLVAREVGERNHNPHGQGALAVSTTKALLTAAVRDAIDGAIAAHAHAQAITCVCILKVCAEADWVRLIGYCMKDQGLAHFLSVHGGLSAEFMNNAADAYTAEAARSSFTSDKGNLLSQP